MIFNYKIWDDKLLFCIGVIELLSFGYVSVL